MPPLSLFIHYIIWLWLYFSIEAFDFIGIFLSLSLWLSIFPIIHHISFIFLRKNINNRHRNYLSYHHRQVSFKNWVVSDTLFNFNAIAPPALSEWVPTSFGVMPFLSSPVDTTVILIASPMSYGIMVFHSCLSQYVHSNVFSVPPFDRIDVTRCTSALTGHILSPFSSHASWCMISFFCPFFDLLISLLLRLYSRYL